MVYRKVNAAKQNYGMGLSFFVNQYSLECLVCNGSNTPLSWSTIFSFTTQSQDAVLINTGFSQYASWILGLVKKKTILSKANKDLKKKNTLKKAVVTETQTSPLLNTEFNKQRSKRLFSALTVQECLEY